MNDDRIMPWWAWMAIISAVFTIGFYAMFTTRIEPGSVGIVVNLAGADVEPEELGVGIHTVAPWKHVYEFPVFEQNHIWDQEKEMVFQTAEGLACSADVGITFHLEKDHIYLLFQKYRRGMDEITDIFVRNNVRDAINRHASVLKIEDLYGKEKESFFESVQKDVAKELEPMGVTISKVYIIGRLHFPAGVVAALNAKIEATQRAQQRENELREAEAQAKKQIAAASGEAQSALLVAEAGAKANLLLSRSITQELIQWQAMQRWDGKLPTTVTPGTLPFIGVSTK